MMAGIVSCGRSANPSATDPYWASVVALLHGDGSNGSQTFVDEKGVITWTANGNAQNSTANKKYGTGSIAFDGAGDYIVASNDAALLFTGDFTIEFWVYEVTTGTSYPFFIDNSPARSYINYGNVVIGNLSTISGFTINAKTVWRHIALTKSGTTVRIFQDGTQLASGTHSGGADFRGMNLARNAFGGGDFLNGYMDELRITAGVARYTANFTAPTEAFPAS